ncbi:hypothetical protein Fleli_1212 [Bernardetia litoralis DSM 6794]|uniref:DUF4349 domain-containing protein n=1 Tax=Bernardetia litoralis (strain ATCC 23117 / DSM 6794 / NBRC 15988 / NCIMB 1366 / Fx l1 / Sio-4) TaxID=880071 RepID=I4AI64_BERLS|nr:DUF4349 domain-containing protein [Bernardetia litoralis]AFM03649.1 hypothetical protein Fleli_1212 [Bernardetia litoralis DSM 6794]
MKTTLKLSLYFWILFIPFFASCQRSEFTEQDSFKMSTEEASISSFANQQDGTEGGISGEPIVQGLHVIKTGDMNLQVQELEKAKEAVLQKVKANKGFTSAANYNDYSSSKQQNITIRVSSGNFENLMKELSTIGFVKNQSQSSQDVSEEFVDIQARLKSKREVENRYSEILKEAKTISEILEIEDKLRVIREEIEAREGRLRYLKDQVSLSTINLTLIQELENYSKAPERSFFSRLFENMGEGWDDFLMFVVGVMRLWVFWIVLIGIIFIITKWRKARKARKVRKR